MFDVNFPDVVSYTTLPMFIDEANAAAKLTWTIPLNNIAVSVHPLE